MEAPLLRLDILRLGGRVEVNWNAHGREDAVNAVPRADVSVQREVAQLSDVRQRARIGIRVLLPDFLQLVSQCYRLAYSSLRNRTLLLFRL